MVYVLLAIIAMVPMHLSPALPVRFQPNWALMKYGNVFRVRPESIAKEREEQMVIRRQIAKLGAYLGS